MVNLIQHFSAQHSKPWKRYCVTPIWLSERYIHFIIILQQIWLNWTVGSLWPWSHKSVKGSRSWRFGFAFFTTLHWSSDGRLGWSWRSVPILLLNFIYLTHFSQDQLATEAIASLGNLVRVSQPSLLMNVLPQLLLKIRPCFEKVVYKWKKVNIFHIF